MWRGKGSWECAPPGERVRRRHGPKMVKIQAAIPLPTRGAAGLLELGKLAAVTKSMSRRWGWASDGMDNTDTKYGPRVFGQGRDKRGGCRVIFSFVHFGTGSFLDGMRSLCTRYLGYQQSLRFPVFTFSSLPHHPFDFRARRVSSSRPSWYPASKPTFF
jgi:hypothetical protein